MKKRDAFSLMEVLVATMIFSFVALSMISVYYAANRNVLQNFRSDKLKADVAISMRAIGNVMSQATRIETPGNGSSGNTLLVLSNVESGSNPCCPMVPESYGAPAPQWHKFCVDSNKNLWYYNGPVTSCGNCPNLTNYSIVRTGLSSNCGSAAGSNVTRILLATNIQTYTPVFSRVLQPTTLTTTVGLLNRTNNSSHTRLVNPQHTVNVYLNTKWNIGNTANALQSPVDYVLEGYFSVLQPR